MENILRTLLSFRCVSGDRQAAHDLLVYVEKYITERGMYVQWIASDGYESIVATVKPGYKTPKVMLAAHADVVPAENSMFSLRKESGRYIGRGVLDMQFAIAAYMHIIDDLYITDSLADYNVGLMITTDEELGGTNGVAAVIDQGYIPQVCLLPDGGDNWQVQTGSKGVLLYKIEIRGTSAHASRPWLGDNALLHLLSILNEIQALVPTSNEQDGTTVVLTSINGGHAANQIPESAVMTIDVRTVGNDEYARLSHAIYTICQKHTATCVLISEGAPTHFELENPLIAPFVRLITSITGTTVKGFYAPASSDARYFVPYGVPCILAYPKGGGHHGPEEWLSVEALDQFKEITQAYLQEVALN